MKNLLIVDDEIHAIEGLKTSLDWEGLGIRVLAAGSPPEARAVFGQETVDFMLCDIEMPQGDGMELATWVRENHPETEIIFLTCHAEFGYARQAIQLGSLDYLLKPVLPADLERTVRKTVQHLEQRRQEQQLSDFGGYWLRSQALFIERFWLDVLNHTIAESPGQLWQVVAERHIPYLPDMRLLPLLVRIHAWRAGLDQKERRNREFAVRQALAEAVAQEEAGSQPSLVRIDSSHTLALFVIASGTPAWRDGLRATCIRFLERCDREFGCTAACHAGWPSGLEGIPAQLEGLRAAARNHVLAQAVVIDLPEPGRTIPGTAAPARLPDMDSWSILLAAGVHETVANAALAHLRHLAQDGHLDLPALQGFRQDFLQMVYLVLGGQRVSAQELLDASIPSEPQSLPELDGWLHAVCRRAVALLRATDDNGLDAVERARRFVAPRLDQPLFCEEIAAHCHVHPDHLSRMFKKETGLGVSAWLIRERMTLAARLIAGSDLAISHIAGEVGYDNFSHFSRMFRQFAGMSPVEYRKSRQEGTET